jgi:hypothetical protein
MVAAIAAFPGLVAAQAPAGTLVVVLSGEAANGSTRAHVSVTTADVASHLVRADSGLKEISFASLPAARYRVETKAIGYAPDTAFVEVRDGRDVNVSVNLKRAVVLDPVTVAGVGKGHLEPFEKRRVQGKGTFLTKEDIEKTRRSAIGEVLRSVRGLRVDCANGCRVMMVRSTACEPRYFINGFPTDAGILLTPVLDVAGIEIYRGPSETPPEFMGAQSMCGAIGIWTK